MHQKVRGAENQKQNNKKDDSRDADDRLRDLPEWLGECTETPVPAHVSLDSDSERPTKVVSKTRQSLPKRPKLRSMLAPCRRRTGKAVPRAEKFSDLITADHKVLNEGR